MRSFAGFPHFLAACLILAVAACSEAAAPPASGEAEAATTPVRLAAAAPAAFLTEISAVGRVEPDQAFILAFKTPGVVSSLAVEEGDTVRKGDILAALDPRDVDAQYRQAQETADKAARDLARARKLHSNGYASDAALQDAEAQAKMTRAAAQAAQSNRGYATIVAPADGVVLKRHVEANGVVAAGTPVLTLSDDSEAYALSVGLPDRDALRVRLGDPATILFDAYPNQAFAASVTEIGADADPRTGTYVVKLRLDAAIGALKSGLVGRAAITPVHQPPSALAIPVDAILDGHGDEALVFVVDPVDGIARKTRIGVGRISGQLVAVTKGLKEGDAVVVDGAGYLSDGEKVAVATATAAAE